jgi:hypothetical protein
VADGLQAFLIRIQTEITMKKTLLTGFIMLFLVACSAAPEIVDNGKPGQIKVILFQDDNRNQVKDKEEVGVVDLVGISQEVSCPPSNTKMIIETETDPNGESLYSDLTPGIYCVMYTGRSGTTTKLTVEVHLSSEQEIVVPFGLTGK